jgi:hypothetical protein
VDTITKALVMSLERLFVPAAEIVGPTFFGPGCIGDVSNKKFLGHQDSPECLARDATSFKVELAQFFPVVTREKGQGTLLRSTADALLSKIWCNYVAELTFKSL